MEFEAKLFRPALAQHRQDAIRQNGRTARIGLRWIMRQERRKACMMAGTDDATVLVVDDQDAIRQFERRALEQAGYQVTEASSGLEALALLEQGRLFDLVIADIAMSGLTGVEMASTDPDGVPRPENPLCHRPARSTDGCPLAVGRRSVSREAVLASMACARRSRSFCMAR